LWLLGKTGITVPMIDRDRPVPPYQQLASIIREQVRTGELARGQRLPSVMKLAEQYGVAQITVQKALRILKDEGLVVGVGGYGTFVAE
jgi:DNA-binding GntR family transcriptional regulator